MPTDSAPPDAEAARAIEAALRAVGVAPTGPHLAETPSRVAALWRDLFSAHGTPIALPADSMFASPDASAGLVLASDLPFHAMCAHHLLPFFGRVHLAFLPGAKLVGFGALARLVDTASRRPTLQEDFATGLADAIEQGLAPRGVAVLVSARHLCMEMRGVKKRARMETIEWRGAFRDDDARRVEFLARVARAVRAPRASHGGDVS